MSTTLRPSKPGQILALTIAAPLPFLENHDISLLRPRVRWCGWNPPGPDNPKFGVAVNFLQDLCFAPC